MQLTYSWLDLARVVGIGITLYVIYAIIFKSSSKNKGDGCM